MKKKIIAILLVTVMIVMAFASVASAASKGTGLYKEDGKWKYFEDGKFKAVNGLVQRPDTKTWHYVEDGIYKKSTGLVQCVQPGTSKGKWYYVEKGDMSKTATGLVQCVQPGKSKGKWYYVKDGKLNNSATGLVQCVQPGSSQGKWYYVENGKLNNKAFGMVQCIQPNSSSKGKWYYVDEGKMNNTATGLVKCIQPGNSYGKWYYVKDGKQNKLTGIVDVIQPDCLFEVKYSDGSSVGGFPVYVESGKFTQVTKLYTGKQYHSGRYKENGKNKYYRDHDSMPVLEQTYYIDNGVFFGTSRVVEFNGTKYSLVNGTYYSGAYGFNPDQGSWTGTEQTFVMTEKGKVKNYTGTVYAKAFDPTKGAYILVEFNVKNGMAKMTVPLKESSKGKPYWDKQTVAPFIGNIDMTQYYGIYNVEGI